MFGKAKLKKYSKRKLRNYHRVIQDPANFPSGFYSIEYYKDFLSVSPVHELVNKGKVVLLEGEYVTKIGQGVYETNIDNYRLNYYIINADKKEDNAKR